MTEAKEFLSLLAQRDAQYADFRFTDLSGAWHHMSMPTSAITKTILEEGIFHAPHSVEFKLYYREINVILFQGKRIYAFAVKYPSIIWRETSLNW